MRIILYGIFTLIYANKAICAPWSPNTREHLFGTQHAATIEDEGFRWRNTFTFNLQDHLGNGLNIQNWEFNGVIQWNTLQHPEIFFMPAANWQQNATPDIIHRHLANIVHNVNRIHRWSCVSASAAAVTIVVENPVGTFNAYSKVITSNANRVYVAKIEAGNITNDVITYCVNNVNVDAFNELLGCNLLHGYNCTEGKLLYNILQAIRLGWNIDQLLVRAGGGANRQAIRLIVLHIGTSMDPCARCTRCLAGLSRRINYGNNTDAQDNPRGLNNFNGINAKFLIEVSSGGHYLTKSTEVDNFARYGYGLCSHTECAGHDGQEGAAINIRLRDPGIPIHAPPHPLPAAFVAPIINGHAVLEHVVPAVHANLFVPAVFAVNGANIVQNIALVNTAAQALFNQIRVMLTAHITVADIRERLAPILNAFVTAAAIPAGNLTNAINELALNANQHNVQNVLNLFYGGEYVLQPIIAANHQIFANSVMNGLILLADDVACVAGHNADRNNMLNTIVTHLTAFRDAGFAYPGDAAGAAAYATFLGAATTVNAQALANALHIGIGPVLAAPAPAQALFIPGGTAAGWEFDHSFPPYIVLGRTESVPDEIRAPIYNGLIRYHCGTIQAGAPNQHIGDTQAHNAPVARNHDCRINLPAIN
ncbi:MAG: hypothetical protein LBS23_00205 [Holosporaceae bacterium]|nr:hypothetical protein [Holosporaceae bacterium]